MTRQPEMSRMAIFYAAAHCQTWDELIALGHEHGLKPIEASWVTRDGERVLSTVSFTHLWDTTNATAVALDYDR